MTTRSTEDSRATPRQLGCLERLVRRFARERTGAMDIHGCAIREGDEVWIYAQDYDKTLENAEQVKIGALPIYLLDESRPHPVADVPLARGVVEWDSCLMAYMIRYTWKCSQWNEGAAGCHMGGGLYAYEISPNNSDQTAAKGGLQ